MPAEVVVPALIERPASSVKLIKPPTVAWLAGLVTLPSILMVPPPPEPVTLAIKPAPAVNIKSSPKVETTLITPPDSDAVIPGNASIAEVICVISAPKISAPLTRNWLVVAEPLGMTISARVIAEADTPLMAESWPAITLADWLALAGIV